MPLYVPSPAIPPGAVTLAGTLSTPGDTNINSIQSSNADGQLSFTLLQIAAFQYGLTGTAGYDRMRLANVIKTIAAVAFTAGIPSSVWAPSGKKYRLMGWALSLTVAGSIIFKDSGGTEFLRTPLMAAGVGMVSSPMGNGFLAANPSNTLTLDVTASGSISGYVFGMEE